MVTKQRCLPMSFVLYAAYTIYIILLLLFNEMKLKELKRPCFILEIYVVNEDKMEENKILTLSLNKIPKSCLDLLNMLEEDYNNNSSILCNFARTLVMVLFLKYRIRIDKKLKVIVTIFIRLGSRKCRIIISDVLSRFCSTVVLMY